MWVEKIVALKLSALGNPNSLTHVHNTLCDNYVRVLKLHIKVILKHFKNLERNVLNSKYKLRTTNLALSSNLRSPDSVPLFPALLMA